MVALLVGLSCLSAGCARGGLAPAVRGSGSLADAIVPLHSDGDGYTLLVKDIQLAGKLGSITLRVEEAGTEEARLETDDNLLGALRLTVEEATRQILLQGDPAARYEPTFLTLTVGAAVSSMELSGAFDAQYDCPSVTECAMVLHGALKGSFTFGSLSSLTLEANGAHQLQLTGQAEKATMALNGATSVSAYGFLLEEATVNVSGAGSCEIYVKQLLDATVDGIGSITYDGAPKTVHRQVSGLGVVKPR